MQAESRVAKGQEDMAGAPALACTAYVNLDKGFNMPRPLILSSYITRAEML